MQAGAGLLRQPEAAAHGADHVLHGIESDAAAGDFGNRFAQAEARQQQELEQFRLRQARRRFRLRQSAPHDGGAQCLEVHARTVVEDHDHQPPGVVARVKRDAPLLGLARGPPDLRRLDAMIHGVAQQVGQRCIELFQDVPVHLGVFAG